VNKGRVARELMKLAKELMVSDSRRVVAGKRPSPKIRRRLEQLRKKIENESISYGEIAELEYLAEYIDDDDTLLLEWAGVPEGSR